MTCLEAQGLITLFINDQLDITKLKEFIDHISRCDDCREELEVYYTLLTGMKQLDLEKNLSDDFHMELVNKIRKTEERIKHTKYIVFRKHMFLWVVILAIALVSSITLSEYVLIETQEGKQDHLDFKFYYYQDKTIFLDEIVMQNYEEIQEHRYKSASKFIR